MVLENFDIAKAAGGTGTPIVKAFTAIVEDHTLKIKLYWAGKGTTGIPSRGTYGPLISAIAVLPSKFLGFLVFHLRCVSKLHCSTY